MEEKKCELIYKGYAIRVNEDFETICKLIKEENNNGFIILTETSWQKTSKMLINLNRVNSIIEL
jgi:hypothetical protein